MAESLEDDLLRFTINETTIIVDGQISIIPNISMRISTFSLLGLLIGQPIQFVTLKISTKHDV